MMTGPKFSMHALQAQNTFNSGFSPSLGFLPHVLDILSLVVTLLFLHQKIKKNVYRFSLHIGKHFEKFVSNLFQIVYIVSHVTLAFGEAFVTFFFFFQSPGKFSKTGFHEGHPIVSFYSFS